MEQGEDENLYDYYERYKRLIASCPYHGYQAEDLICYIIEGLCDNDKRLVNASCGGSYENLTPAAAFQKVEILAEQARNQRSRTNVRSFNVVNESLNAEVRELKDLMKQLLTKRTAQQVNACGLCYDAGHHTDQCPTIQETEEAVNAIGNYGAPRPRNDPYSNTYNPGWANHPNLRWNNQQQQDPPQQ